jgi:hypothetical protein
LCFGAGNRCGIALPVRTVLLRMSASSPRPALRSKAARFWQCDQLIWKLYDYIFQKATLESNKPLLSSRSKWLKVHSNTPHVHSLVEALRAPEVAKMLQGAKFAREGLGLEKWVHHCIAHTFMTKGTVTIVFTAMIIIIIALVQFVTFN